jgi:hypothetical protein
MVNAFADNPEQQFSEEAGIFAVLTSTRSSLSSVFDIQRVADETFCQYLARCPGSTMTPLRPSS